MTSHRPLNRRALLVRLAGGAILAATVASPFLAGRWTARANQGTTAGAATPRQTGTPEDWRALTEDDWRARLGADVYEVLREQATEPAFSSPLDSETAAGTYVCAGCALPLFSSETKYDSGTGWPSFYAPLPDAVATRRDFKLIFPRMEYHCQRCGGHQGHVFDDGPEPTGKRYCNNGLALDFIPASG